jgi:hypothetical protein
MIQPAQTLWHLMAQQCSLSKHTVKTQTIQYTGSENYHQSFRMTVNTKKIHVSTQTEWLKKARSQN